MNREQKEEILKIETAHFREESEQCYEDVEESTTYKFLEILGYMIGGFSVLYIYVTLMYWIFAFEGTLLELLIIHAKSIGSLLARIW